MNRKIIQVVIGLPVEGPFDYLAEGLVADKVQLGHRVRVPFRKVTRIGYVVHIKQRSQFSEKLKSVTAVLDDYPALDETQLKLTKEFAAHYGCSWGEAVEAVLPATLRKSPRNNVKSPLLKREYVLDRQPFKKLLLLENGQESPWKDVCAAVKETTQKERRVIIVVPDHVTAQEVSSQLNVQGIKKVFSFDKRLTQKQEMDLWRAFREGQTDVVIGPRSVIFNPMKNCGLIVIIDEEHNSYKQEQSPFYHVRDVAFLRSKIDHADVLFVSAAPTPELWKQLKNRDVISIGKPQENKAHMIDLTNYGTGNSTFLSSPLRNKIEKMLKEKKKVLLFYNRVGLTTHTRCSKCSFIFHCQRCHVSMAYLPSKKKLVCRRCKYNVAMPSQCPKCKAPLTSWGGGLEKMEQNLKRIFPYAWIARYDRDTKVFPKKFDVLLATQAILKFKERLFFHLVGVLEIDGVLHRFDFRSAHQAFSLMMRLSSLAKEDFTVQTRLRDSYALKAILRQDRGYFYKNELEVRKEMGFPPYGHLISIGMRSIKEEAAFEQCSQLYDTMNAMDQDDIQVFDPQADVVPKLRDKYRFVLLAQGKSIKRMLAFIKEAIKKSKRKRGVITTINVDP